MVTRETLDEIVEERIAYQDSLRQPERFKLMDRDRKLMCNKTAGAFQLQIMKENEILKHSIIKNTHSHFLKKKRSSQIGLASSRDVIMSEPEV